MAVITDLFAGVPVSDLEASIDWYTRFFGRAPTMRVGDEVLERLAAAGIEHEPIETYANGVRHARVPDPDGNAIALAEAPAAPA